MTITAGLADGIQPSDRSLERLIFFSDALFAISITLLILDIDVPALRNSGSATQALASLAVVLPSLFAFILSFVVVAVFWQAHHRLFATAKHFDRSMIWPNLLFLMAIVFMPFATALVARNGNAFAAALVYNLTLLVSASFLWLLARNVMRFGGGHEKDNEDIREDWRTVVTVIAASLCVGLTFVVPEFSQLGMLLAALGPLVIRRWLDRKTARNGSTEPHDGDPAEEAV